MNHVVPAFRVVAIAEALSWTGLLIGMVFKYLVVGDDIGVRIFGPIHGGLFVLYLVVALLARHQLHWGTRTTIFALVASVPPLGTLVFERWATRTGRLSAGPAGALGAGALGAGALGAGALGAGALGSGTADTVPSRTPGASRAL